MLQLIKYLFFNTPEWKDLITFLGKQVFQRSGALFKKLCLESSLKLYASPAKTKLIYTKKI